MARPIEYELQLLVDRFVGLQMSNIVETVARAIDLYANSRTSKQLQAFFEQIATGPGQEAAARAHAELAHEMRGAVRRSWGQARRKLRPAVYSPRRSSRFSGGMQRIMDSDYLVQSDARGVRLGPIAEMDRDAAQWARIEFGALPRGEGAHRAFPVRFSNLPTIEFTLEESARPGYGLPVAQGPGGRVLLPTWKGPGGEIQRRNPGDRSGALYPLPGSRQELPTRGNVGFHVLEAGIARFFERFPVVYGDLFREVLPSSQRVGRPPRGLERHTVTSPS